MKQRLACSVLAVSRHMTVLAAKTDTIGPCSRTVNPMTTIELTDAELRMVQSALRSYLSDFGHVEAAELHTIKQFLAKLSVHNAPEAESA
jgi:hypothetical protein